jgi:hypothetical protein
MMISTIVGALAGAIIAGLIIGFEWLIQKLRGRPFNGPSKWFSWLSIVAIIAAIGIARSSNLFTPSLESQMDNGSPIFAVIHKYYPDEYAKLVSAIQSSQIPTSDTTALRNLITPIVSQIIASHKRQIDGDNASALFLLLIDESKALRDQYPEACIQILSGGTTNVPLGSVYSPQLIQEDATVETKILVQVATNPAPPPTPLSQDQMVSLGQSALSTMTTEEKALVLPLLQNSKQPSTNAEYQAMCDFNINLFTNVFLNPGDFIRGFVVTY